MKTLGLLSMVAAAVCLASCGESAAESGATRAQFATNLETFTTTGVVRELKAGGKTVVVTPLTNRAPALEKLLQHSVRRSFPFRGLA